MIDSTRTHIAPSTIQNATPRKSRVSTAFLATYVPRQCGIATFTRDLYGAIRTATDTTARHRVIAVNGPGSERFEYPGEVGFEMHRDRLDDYQRAADFINFSDVDIVSIQHEFGIFGGEAGMHLLRLLRSLRKPTVATLHTVLRDPEPHYRRGLMALAHWANVLVTMTQHSRQILIEQYGLDPARVEVIPHGTPPLPDSRPRDIKARYNIAGRPVLLTFGLLGPGKGVENALYAMAKVARKHPEIIYLVVGATHPEVKRLHGEDYRLKLQRIVKELGLRQNVLFYNQYLSQEELVDFLRMCDIYVIPYPNLEQVVSGTLAYALAMGTAVVSTPFLHAREVLVDGRGLLVEPGNAEAMADALTGLLDQPERIDAMKSKALVYGRETSWPEVGKHYTRLFDRVLNVYSQTIRVQQAARPIVATETVVEPRFDHMRRLTDDTGILQHAIYRTPNRFHGYSTSDNARALQVAVMNQDALDALHMGHLTSRYLGFLHYAQREDGQFHNFMNYKRQWLDDVGSEDSQGRALSALGTTVNAMRDPLDRLLAKQMFDRALEPVRRLHAPQARAHVVMGLASYLQHYPEAANVRRILAEHAAALAELYSQTHRPDWHWFEPTLTSANAKLCEAMLLAGEVLENPAYRTIGVDSLRFLTDQTLEDDHFSFVGNQGVLEPGRPKPPFGQQPVEAGDMTSAYRVAARILDDDTYLILARKALDWFLGANDLHVTLYDLANGGCCDGLEATGANLNQGAESTLSCLKAITLLGDPNNRKLL